MTDAIRPLIAGNWKMNGMKASTAEFDAMLNGAAEVAGKADLLVCPPATLIAAFAEKARGRKVAVGAQDCHPKASGAHTGDIAAEMLADAGASAIIVGHSERRQYHGETDAIVAAKARATWRAGVMAIICVGETESERMDGEALKVVSRQIDGSVPEGATASNTAVAYEPVWAIGTGKTPTSMEIVEMHAHIQKKLADRLGQAAGGVRILYGGSVKPSNAAEILKLENVNGALVGGASLKAVDFLTIIEAAPAS